MSERAFVLVPLRDLAPDLVVEVPAGSGSEGVVRIGPLGLPVP
jgi:7,8-dihydro-6-hydroxymethylpterin-pyrophosphokinase